MLGVPSSWTGFELTHALKLTGLATLHAWDLLLFTQLHQTLILDASIGSNTWEFLRMHITNLSPDQSHDCLQYTNTQKDKNTKILQSIIVSQLLRGYFDFWLWVVFRQVGGGDLGFGY